MTVNILEICKVTPPPESVTADMHLPLTFFDLLWLRSQPVEYLFFYEHPSHEETFFSTVTPKLKHSLSQTLEHFLPSAGNITWTPSSPSPVICYKNGDGILITIAQSDDDFFHLSRNDFREADIFKPLIANIVESDSQVPLVAIKTTFFPNKGYCFGITVHHAVFDGNSFTNFMKAWTSNSELGESQNLNLELKPIFDRKAVRERYKGLEDVYIDALLKQNCANPRSLSNWNFESQPNKVRGTFRLSGLDVKKLKKLVHAQLGNHEKDEVNHDLKISTFVVTYAYLIGCFGEAKDMIKDVCFSIVVDCRGRLELPISTKYFGNCLGFVVGDVERVDLFRDDRFLAAVLAIHRTIKNLNNGVLEGAQNWLSPDAFKKGEKGEAIRIYLAGSTRLDPYSVDFGWGKPRKVSISSIDKTGAVSLMKGRNGEGGIELELCLCNDEMQKFAYAFAQGLSSI